jgi:hypothetical protein
VTVDVDPARREELASLERDAPPVPDVAPGPRSRREGRLFAALAFLIAGPPALLTRLVTAPWRERIRARRRVAAAGRREKLVRKVEAQTRALERTPDDVKLRLARGLDLMTLGRSFAAERDFDLAAGQLEAAGGKDRVRLSVAYHNRGAARGQLGFPRLAALDEKRGHDTGVKVVLGGAIGRRLVMFPVFLWTIFLVLAGFVDD